MLCPFHYEWYLVFPHLKIATGQGTENNAKNYRMGNSLAGHKQWRYVHPIIPVLYIGQISYNSPLDILCLCW